MNHEELVEALRQLHETQDCNECEAGSIGGWCDESACVFLDAAAAIEALQAEVQSYKALVDEWQSSAENKERLLGLYRAEQAKHFYSATDDNGRIKVNPCTCMNIPIFPDSSESPNS